MNPQELLLTNDEKKLVCSELKHLKKRISLVKFAAIKSASSSTDDQQLEQFTDNVDAIIQIINSTVESANSLEHLSTEVDKLISTLTTQSTMKLEITDSINKIKSLEQEIQKTKDSINDQQHHYVAELNGLKDDHHRIKAESKECLDYADMYFKAEVSNMECRCRHELEELNRKIKSVESTVERDVRCLAVMDAWTDDFCEQIELKINEWRVKLRRDEMIMEMRVEGKRRNIQGHRDTIAELNETIAERLEELAPWEEEKEVERQERLAHMRRYYSCRKIQRWWRGHMVKQKLYRRRTKVKPNKV